MIKEVTDELTKNAFNSFIIRARQLLSPRKRALKANPAKDCKVSKARPVFKVTMALTVNPVPLAVPAHLAKMARWGHKVNAVCPAPLAKLLK